MSKFRVTIIFIFVIVAIGMNTPAVAKDSVQKNICHVQDGNAVEKQCKNGDVVLFQPQRFGNMQVPLVFSTAFCNYEYQIVYNKGGVSCIFTDLRKKNWRAFGIGEEK